MVNDYLNVEDFGVENGHLVINRDGVMFVMFTSKNCKYCDIFMPQFKQLTNHILGVNFGICSLDDRNRQIVQMSQQSSSPIKGVPFFLLFNSGIPFSNYTGERSANKVLQFLQEMLGKMQPQQFVEKPRRTRTDGGTPMNRDHVQVSGTHGPGRSGGNGNNSGGDGFDQFTVNSNTGVREYKNFYGRPYNMSEAEFIEYENAYSTNKK